MSSDDKSAIIGIASHICAASAGGPRYNKKQTPLERASISNGIWLCANCASLIDKHDGSDYKVRLLKKWKKDAEAQAYQSLISSVAYERPSWLSRMSTLHYVNVPRIAQLETNKPISEGVLRLLNDGIPTQGMIVRELVALESAIENAQIEALPVEDVVPAAKEIIGCTISFHRACYTKNGVIDPEDFDITNVRQFNPKKSPHFYSKVGMAKIIFPYDPRWITTNTAYSDFRSGRVKFAGLGVVKRVSDDLSEIIASPLIVGLPRHPAWGGLF